MKVKKQLLLTSLMLMNGAAMAQTININFDPATSSLRTSAPPVVNIICFIFLIVAVIGAVWEYNKDNKQAMVGFIMAIVIAILLWATVRIAITAFL